MSSRHPFSGWETLPNSNTLQLFPEIPESFHFPAVLPPSDSDSTTTELNTLLDSSYTALADGDSKMTSERRATHIRRSCEVCRASKGRCCPSTTDPGRCQKCVRDGKTCVFLEARPRPKRVNTAKTRVAAMEQKLDGLLALLASRNVQETSKGFSLPATPRPQMSIPTLGLMESMTTLRPESTTQNNSPAWMSSFLPGPRFDGVQDVISKGLIDLDKAEHFLRNFNANACKFPFIYIHPQLSLESLRREKPFLLLCILTMSANNFVSLQRVLEMQVRETLARKVIINCEKNLDILQGLLIYVAWYHRYFDPKREQIYQLTQMIIAMAIELGITGPATKVAYRLQLCEYPQDANKGQDVVELEEQRTFLGCYYLASCLSFAFRKPSTLKYTDYTEVCSQALSQAREAPTDHLLQYFILLSKLASEVNSTFDYDHYQQLPLLDAVRIETLVTMFNKQLKHFEETFPSDALENIVIQMSMLHMKIYIFEIALHAFKPAPSSTISGQPGCQDWYSAVARTDMLLSCVTAAKKYLDKYITLSKDEMQRNTMLQEINLIYVVLILGRFTTGVDSPFLDPAYLRETASFSHYMSALVDHMSKLIVFTSDGREQVDLFWHFRRIFQYTKNWSFEQTKNGNFTTIDASGIQDCINLSFLEILQMEVDPQYAYENDCPPESMISEDDLWAEAMQDTWPLPTVDPHALSANVMQ